MAEDYLKSASNPDFGYGQLLTLLLRRSLWFTGTFVLVLVAAALATLFAKPTYRSSMQLLVEPNYETGQPSLQQEGDAQSFQSDRQNEIDYATQLNLMRSYQFMNQAIGLLREEYPDLTLKEVREKLSLQQLEEGSVETKIFEVIYTDNDPVKTQRMLETIQSIYQDYNLEQQELRLGKGLSLINEQLDMVRQELAKSQGQLKQFRQAQNLIDPEQQATALAEALNNVTEAQREVLTEYRDVEARYATLQQQIALSPQAALIASRLSQSSRYQELLNELQKTELELATNQVTYTDTSPRVQSLVQRRQNQLDLLNQEVGRVLGSAGGQADGSGESILRSGQLGATDLTLAQNLAEAQMSLASLAARSESLTQSETQLREELNRFPNLIDQYDRLQPEVEIQRTILEQLLEDRQKLMADLAKGGFNWEIVEAPQLGEKTSPRPLQNLLIGAVVGIFLGAIAAFVRESLDNVFRSLNDLEKQVEVPILGALPKRRMPRSPFGSSGSIVQTLMHPSLRESLDLIYKNIQFQNSDKPLKSLMVTSALPEEGKTALVLGLAFSAARLHQRVLIVDANLRQPAIHQVLGLNNQQGLATAIEQAKMPEESIHHLTVVDAPVDVLTAGTAVQDPMRLLSSQRFRDVMANFAEHYDLILLDAPPVGLVDAMQIGSLCSGVLLVARLHQVTRVDLAQAIAALNPLNLLGVVVNGAKLSSTNSTRTIDSQLFLQVQPLEENNKHITLRIDRR
ncbi:polysaccharide biosynthesis tyrosine autokinase [Phormidium tenue FACHB-886]|nr:polysaccharide biosynthesis tyrosine autokinase [Phormidium tenue FACHB-886]